MSDLKIIITDAGRAALVNAAHNGTAPVIISHCGVSNAALVPSPAATTLPGEIKRIGTLSGDVVAADAIHITVRDESADAYSLRSLALYLADGTLFAVYGQAAPIMEKSSQALLLLAIDAQFTDVDASSISFGDTNFLNPPATTERQGVAEFATEAETTTGTDPNRAVTPKGLKAAVTSWLNERFGAGAPSAFVKGLLLITTAPLFRKEIGLDKVNNTPDVEKPVSTPTQNALNNKVDKVSAARPGVNRLYRGDDDSGFHVAVTYDGSRWFLQGWNPEGAFHAECRVAYADVSGWAGAVDWGGVANRPTALSSFVNNMGYITQDGRSFPRRANDGTAINFNWSGQAGQPEWLWGGNNGTDMYVYNPRNFHVSYADSAGSAGNADTVDGYHGHDLAKYADFVKSMTSNGYVRIPGGFVLQWVRGASGTAEAALTVTWPLAFSTVIDAMVGTTIPSAITQADVWCQLVGAPTNTGATIMRGYSGNNGASAGAPVVWAIGEII